MFTIIEAVFAGLYLHHVDTAAGWMWLAMGVVLGVSAAIVAGYVRETRGAVK